MKLRLPHKFQAALMAALASVSFTTLSSATAYATTLEDAALGLDDFTTASVQAAQTDGWRLSNISGSDTGVYTTTTSQARIDKNGESWATQNGNRCLWSAVVTFDINTLPTNTTGTLIEAVKSFGTTANADFLEGIGYDSNGNVKLEGAWNNGAYSGLTTTSDLRSYADANGLVTVGLTYHSGNDGTAVYVWDQRTQVGGLRSTNEVDGNLVLVLANKGNVEISNLYLFGNTVDTADMQSMMKEAGAYYWTGSTDGNWNAATTNWTHYGSSVAVAIGANGGNAHTNVVFGADATNKNVTLAGATTVGALTVSGGDYTFNLNGNLTTSGITIASGASLAYAGTGSISGTLSGAGTFILPNNSTSLGVTVGTDWTGTVKVSNVSAAVNFNLNTYGRTGSKVEVAGVAGHLLKSNETFAPEMVLSGDGLKLTNGYGGYSYTFAGGISGSGNFEQNWGNGAQTFTLQGDLSRWTGDFKKTGNNTTTINLTAVTSATVGAGFQRTAGTLNINVGDGTAALSTAIERAVNASNLAIKNNASATLKETLTLTNDLTLDGSATLEKGGSVGVIDLSHGGNAHGTLTLAAGQNLTYGSSFWGANNNKLILGEGALVKQASNASIEIVGLAGESYVSSSANKQFSLSESAYTLYNVQATIKTANNDVQLHFDNSKLVAEQDITLKDLQSVFSGVDIKGGTTTVGASGASGTVMLGAVTLSNGGNLALADLVTGNVSSIDVTGTSAISGGTLSMGGTITTQADARLTLGGTVLFANGGIATSGSGTLDFADDVMFDIRQLTEGENHTYTLFTGSGADLLTRFGDTAGDHIAGAVTTGRKWFFNDNGQAYYELLSQELLWDSRHTTGTWTTDQSVKLWQPVSDPLADDTYFSDGDGVLFNYTSAPTTVTLGSDVTASTMTLGDYIPDVTIENGGDYTLSVDELDIQTGRLTTKTAMNVKSVNIAAGAEWALGYAQDLGAVTTFNNNGLLRVLDGVVLHVRKGTTAESIGTVTADAGGTLYVENGSGTGDSKYTYHGSADDPFEGTLVYDINSTSGHDASIALENFQGTLELRGRLDAHDSSFGGMTKLVLNGDRATNTTGMWINGSALTLDVPVDIAGENTVDLYTSTDLTINGDINAGGAAGILGKRDGGALNLNGNVNLLGLNVYQNTVHLNGGAQKAYNLGAVTLNGGSLAVDAAGVGSLSAADLIVISTNTLSSATAEPTEFNVTRFDVSNHNTNFTLQNVELNVSGAATAAELNTAQNVDAATVTVGSDATLNLNGSVVWKKADGAKTDYVNLTIANGGTANVNGGTGNILNDVTVNAGGKLNFASNTGTEIAGSLALADTIDNSGNVTINSASVAAGQVGTLTGTGTYTIQGTVAAEGTLKLDGTTVSGAGTEAAPAALTGNVDINGGTIGGTMNIGSDGSTVSILESFSVANGAKLSFNGHVVLDALEATAEEHYIHGEQDDDNGFLSGISVKVYTPGENVDVIFPGGITYKGADVYDYTESGTFSTSSVNYTTFFVNAAGTTESLDHALAAAEGHGTMTTVQLANGTSLAVDRADATLPHLVLTEGASATLNVTKNATITTAETGNGLTLTGDGALTLGANGNDASLSGAGTLTINGPTVTINGTNKDSFSANIDVVSGTLKLGDSSDDAHWTDRSALGELNWAADSTRTITIHSGAVVDINGKTDNNYVYTLDGGTLTNTGAGLGRNSSQTAGLILTADSYVGDSEHNSEFWLRQRGAFDSERTRLELNGYNLTKRGTGTFGLNTTTVTGTGYLVVESGTVQLNGGTFGANLRMAGGTVAGTLNLAGNITIDTTKDSTISAVIAGSGKSITKTGDGTLTLSGANTYTGATTVSAGTLQFNQGFNFGSTVSGAGNITYGGSANGTLNFGGNDISGWTGSFNNTGSATATLNITRNNGHVKAAIGNEQGGTINITSANDVFFDNVVNINDITHNVNHTLYIGTDSAKGLTGEMTVTGHASTGRLVVGNASGDSAAVFTLSGENARLSNGTDHTYNAQVQGYGTFLVTNHATQSLTAGNLGSFHGTFAADGEGSILTLNTTLANDVTLKATNGGEIKLMKSYTMGDNTAVDGGTLAVSNGLVVNGTVDLSKGTLTQTGGTVTVNADKSLTLGNASITSAIANSGTVTFTKDITATGLAKEGEDVSYRVGADDNKSTNGNYFFLGERTESTLRVVTGGTVNPGGHKVTQGGFAYTLASDGTATGVSADEVNYYIFYQSEAGTTLNVSDIAATSEKHGAYLSQVAVDGANLVVDQSVAYVQLVNASVTNTVNAGNIDNLQVAGGDNTLVGSVTSLSAVTQFVQGAAGSLKMQNATASPYQVNAGNDITFADTDSVTIHAAVAEAGSEQFDVYSLNNARFTVEAGTMQAMNTTAQTVDNHLKVASIGTAGGGSLTLANGVEETLKNVTAVNGNIQFLNMAEARGTTAGEQTQVGLDSLYIGSSKAVSFYENGIVDAANEASVTVSGTLTAGSGAQLNADLEMAKGSHLDVSGAQSGDVKGLLMGSEVTLNSDSYLDIKNYTQDQVSGYLYDYLTTGGHDLYYLFSGTENDPLSLKIDGAQVEQLTFTDWQHFDKDASEVYANLQAQTFYMVYDGSNVGMVAIGLLPEPTTSTLSLLALCALAARRRRKG